ncbi:MAG: GNAT family N-acetyltransferase [Erysipelotrichaceae bacterium]|nr:GNAT family N-acetyltransferase [Erysipelotrichaceae bacterium]
MKDITEVRNPLIYGLFEEDELIGFSIGRIKHWCGGTEYYIEEMCIRPDHQHQGYGKEFFALMENKLKEKGLDTIYLMTDRDKPSYVFYKKTGFTEIPELTSFYKSF